ncbi:MAG: multicopper oxidase family protein [Acidimicrobiales bacterium]
MNPIIDRQWSRRRFLLASGVLAGSALSGCRDTTTPQRVGSSGDEVRSQERKRAVAGAGTKTIDLVAGPLEIDLAGRIVNTVGYGSSIPGPEIRLRAGDTLEVRLENRLQAPTTVHWHGLAIRNDMDGVPDMTQLSIAPGQSFTYRFTVPDPGTYWFHPHMGLDLDRAMYAPLIVEDPTEPGAYDTETVLMFDDWLDGIDGASPEATFDELRSNGAMGSMDHGMMGTMSGGPGSGAMSGMNDWGDVTYPLHLINGRPPADAMSIAVAAGGRVRLRMINAGSDTVYRIAVGAQPMLVTHLDGFPIEPIEVDTVLLSMGERVDVTVTVPSGVWPVLALAEGKAGSALAWLRTNDAGPSSAVVPDRLPGHDGRILDPASARATEAVAFDAGKPDRTIDVELTGGMMGYEWGIDGRRFGQHRPIDVGQGERLRLRLQNQTMMVHPMHLHGHTFALAGERGARKDTVLVRPMQSIAIDVLADNPGQWMAHCHNTYHLEAGMATVLSYLQ